MLSIYLYYLSCDEIAYSLAKIRHPSELKKAENFLKTPGKLNVPPPLPSIPIDPAIFE